LHSVEIKSVDAARVRRCMDQYATELLATNPAVQEIVVFGSFAEDTYAPGSDLDVFIVLSAAQKRPRDRIPDFLRTGFPVPIDVFPFTGAEMAELEPSPLLAAVRKSNWRYKRPEIQK
jgi:predicted nucleotidyltransferase